MSFNIHRWILWFAAAAAGAQTSSQPVYVSFFIHCEASPIRGVPMDVQFEPYSGQGMPPRHQYIDKILDLCERYRFKFELATTPLFAQQLREDRPEVIERIKRLKIPISRYPSIAGHVLPPPIGELRQMPGMRLHQLRNRQTSWERYLENEWLAETRTLVPGWRLEGERLILDNPRVGTPAALEELPEYRIPKDERRMYSGTLALEEVFDVIPLPAFPPLFQGDTTRFNPSPVQRALGMNSFRPSVQPFAAFPAPFQAGDRRMLDWFKQHFPATHPLHADAAFMYTHDYQGRYIGLNLHEDLIQFILSHPDQYRIVWPDPEEVQYRPEHRPRAFFQQTHGVSSLEQVRQMPAPLALIRQMDPSIPIREVTRSETASPGGWQKETLFTLSELGISSAGNLPDFLRPRTEWVSREAVFSAARDLLERTRFRQAMGVLPLSVKAGGQTWSLNRTFVALASYLEQFALYEKLPAGLSVITDVLGPVQAEPDREVDRLQGVPDEPFLNEVNLLHAVYETAEQVRKELKIPAKIAMQISRGRAGNYSGRRSQVNPAEMLYAMAEELALMEKVGLPDEVEFKRVRVLPEQAGSGPPGWVIEQAWSKGLARPALEKTIAREEIRHAADFLLSAWTAGHLGHTEDIGGPPYGVALASGKRFSLSDVFQALAFSLVEQKKTGRMPEGVAIGELLGPLDYPMYALRNEPVYNTRLLRGGWQPYQMDVRDFPAPDLINVQGLPGPGHGGYEGFLGAAPLMASVERAVERLRATGIIPGSVPVELPQGRKYPQASAPHAYINAAELLWAMAQLYRFQEVLGKQDDVLLRSCRLIKDQLHAYIVGLTPVGFTRAVYEYRRDSFDWIEQTPAWRIERTWSYR
ncbi:MAG: hypothetical protein HY235_21085 [Acidobacteria bacterium]|nr:hypothetical protein [Acidobacteriota bacterium]